MNEEIKGLKRRQQLWWYAKEIQNIYNKNPQRKNQSNGKEQVFKIMIQERLPDLKTLIKQYYYKPGKTDYILLKLLLLKKMKQFLDHPGKMIKSLIRERKPDCIRLFNSKILL